MHTREFIDGRWVNSFTYSRADLKERLKEDGVVSYHDAVFDNAFKNYPSSCSLAAQSIKNNRYSSPR